MSIPKIIHQTAKSFDALPQDFKDNIAKLKALNPDWDHRFYDDAAMKAYIQQHVSEEDWFEVQKIAPQYSVVFADLFRYLAIYNEGGAYLDIKSTAKKPLNQVIGPDCKFIISQWPNKLGERFQGAGQYPDIVYVPGGEFQQWHVIAVPKHAFLKAVIDRTLYNIKTYTPKSFGTGGIGVFRLSGPICYTQAIWPLIGHYPADVIEINDIGIWYSIYEDVGLTHAHNKNSGHYSSGHYSTATGPIVVQDVYVEPQPPFGLGENSWSHSLGELLARELRENTDLALKLAVSAIVATAAFVVLLPLVLIWLLR